MLVSECDDTESWPEPVVTTALLEEVITCIKQHIKAKPYEVLAIALWVLMAWVHEVAAHYSVYLVATSPDPGIGQDHVACRCGRAAGAKAICQRQRPDHQPASFARLIVRSRRWSLTMSIPYFSASPR